MKRWMMLTTLLILLAVLPLRASAEGNLSGTCGENAVWSFDSQSNTLTISGQGAIRDDAQEEFADFCGAVTKVVIEDGITSIGANALHNLIGAYEVVLPASVQYIGTRGLPANVNNTNSGPLIYISSLEHWLSVDLQENFCNAAGIRLVINGELLTALTIPDGITKIPKWAFTKNSDLQVVSIPDSVTEIEHDAFSACMMLRNVDMGNGVTKLGDRAFATCMELKTVTVSSKLTYVGAEAFSGCRNLKDFALPDSVTYVGPRAFYLCRQFLEFRWPSCAESIPDEVFMECKALKKLEIPASVTAVGNWILCNVNNSQCEVVFEGGPPSISETAFSYFTGTATYPGGRGWTEAHTLPYGGNVTWQVDPNTVEAPSPEGQLPSSPNISWKIENGTLYISGSGYMELHYDDPAPWVQYKDTVKAVEIPSGILNVGTAAFQDFTELERVKLPEGLQIINSAAFSGCVKLTQIHLPESLIRIEAGAFRFCTGLTEINLPDSLEEVENITFEGCGSLQSVTIPKGIHIISQGVFKSCTGLTEIVLPENITYISESAFMNCRGLKTVEMQGPVTVIGRWAFNGCSSLEKVEIPASVTTIGNEFLAQAMGLKEIIFRGNMPQMGDNLFPWSMSTYTLYYPKGNPTWDEAYLASLAQQYNPRLTVVALDMGSQQPPVTEPPATEPPVTEPPVTEPSATEPSATEPSATVPPATEPPATEPTVTEPGEINSPDPAAPVWIFLLLGVCAAAVMAIVLWRWIKRRGKAS